eukprot:TRINITY_DN103303_c0_g1_i1.p1 TRINITY_DN103303_c0_g1~~TRINITY_DN103303_c0_g1_i1.p1  ORF type:complete len:735 (+),score=162.54 TRINITY_DN103303_c0_g1_i1:129-2333(+)
MAEAGRGYSGTPASPRAALLRRKSSRTLGEQPLKTFKSLAQGIRGLARAQVIADAGLPQEVDVTGLIRRIALTLAYPATFDKALTNLFSKLADVRTDDGYHISTARVPELLGHWGIPEDHASIFWALLRKHQGFFDCKTLPESISLEDTQQVLIKVLRRVRDKYCQTKVSRSQFITQNRNVLEHDYVVEDFCGKGSFGECMWVKHRTSKLKRVCKKIRKDETNMPEEEVATELSILIKLDHPNVLRVFEWFEDDRNFMLVTEAALGGDLKQLLASVREQRLEEDEEAGGLEEHLACMLLEQALRGLAYVHSMYVLHRDIKPGNMLLATLDHENPRLLLADFGVSEIFQESVTINSMIRGSVAYMALEVFDHHPSPLSDVWAMGVVAYELLAGDRPFSADNAMAMYAQLKYTNANLDKLRKIGASEAAVAFVQRILVKEESKRPLATEIIEDPWLSDSKHRIPAGRQARKARKSLLNFTHMSYVAKAAMNCIAAQLDTSKIEGLVNIFQSLDMDADGKLSAAELAAGLAELGAEPDSIGQLLSSIDVDGDGHIQYTEFVASLLQVQGKLVDDVVYHAFHIFDVNGDGHVTLDELRTMLSGDGPLAAVLPDGKTVEQALAEMDLSRDGVVSFDEFKSYLLSQCNGHAAMDPGMGRILSCAGDGDESESGESLDFILRRLSRELGRPEAELSLQAQRLTEEHWISTVGDLQKLSEADWPRLGLPLKLERILRSHIGL